MKELTSWAPSLVSAVILVGVMSFEAPIALMAQGQNQNLVERVTRLEFDLEAETLDRQDADTSEATVRQVADDALETDLAAETAARQDADTSEATVRQAADDALDSRVTTNEGDITALETDVAGALEARQLNPLQVALLRWYEASEAGNDFAVGNQSSFVAFDGANIWVTNQSDDTVSKLRASYGMTLGTFAVGRDPLGLAFDGAHIWVANEDDATVSKLRASDGVEAAGSPFAVGNDPFGVAFDGANIWVTNFSDHTVSKLRASDGMALGTFAVGNFPLLMAFDGANIWVANALGDTLSKR